MAASDSENFESADEDVEITSASTKCNVNNSNESEKKVLINSTTTSNSDSVVASKVDRSENKNTVIKVSNIGRKSVKEDKTKRQNVQRDMKTSESGSGVKRLGLKLDDKRQNSDKVTSKHNVEDSDANSVPNSKELVKNVCNNDTEKCVSKVRDKLVLSSSDDNLVNSDKNYNILTNDNEVFGGDGWELEDGFDMPSDAATKPNDEEFEKELFPVLNKLSTLSTGNNTHLKSGDNMEAFKGTTSGSNWSSWGNWGVSSLLSTATESVSTLTSHMSAGLNTVLESGLGAPDPEVLAQVLEKERLEKEAVKDGGGVEEVENSTPGVGVAGLGGGFSQLMSGMSQLSTKVISGGLDTLETLGKKTMEVLQEGDPGLRKKRALFFQDDDRPVLSQVLREAKDNAELSNKIEEDKQAARRVHFETLFDDYHGLVHLEALEMLSKQCQLKIHTILLGMSGDALKDLRETLDQVKELCELSDEEDEETDKDDDNYNDFSKKVVDAIDLMGIQVPSTKLVEVSESISNWLVGESAKTATPSEVHEKAVSTMAEFTSVSMEAFHRMAELLLIKGHHSTADEAESLTQLTGTLCARVSRMATKFTLLLSQNDESKVNNGIITTIFMESANSSSYIQDACRLVVPVLQVGAST